jgi:UDP-N-acetylmuramoyl-L-alanyl-D-glutamate--2,6-diaminopimelate ligase
MLLSKLIVSLSVSARTGPEDVEISRIQFDSRKIAPGDLFVAVRGTASDGHDFIGTAITRGAIVIVCENIPEQRNPGVCYIETKNSGIALGKIASAFYGNPSTLLKLIGITGTNGKTTTATLLYQLFIGLGYCAGLISTIINKINGREFHSTHTTPDPIQLNELLARMVADGCEYCFMEVSSHAVDQNRIAGLSFCGGVFTNLTHDHLDYHKTFNAYLQAKKTFFDSLPSGSFSLVNKDDKNGAVMQQNTQASKHTYSLQSMADFRCRMIENSFGGLLLNMDGDEVWFKMIGKFNASNLLAVYSTARLLNQDKTAVLEVLSRLEPVSGRFNYVRTRDNITAIVDYAHTPDALKNVLDTINEIRNHREKLITVVGAGGNRDTTKRPVMAKIAVTFSDLVILTSDNPRNEEPAAILEEMKAGIDIQHTRKFLVIENSKEAIKTACTLAKPGDIILVAGKGHETYQEIKGIRHHFDDKEVLGEIFGIENLVKI